MGQWIKDKKKYFFNISEKQIEFVIQILEKFPSSIDYEKERDEADPWIIALAKEKSEKATLFGQNILVYVVSQEKLTSSKKIPAICKHFKILHMNLEQFFNDVEWKFGIIKE